MYTYVTGFAKRVLCMHPLFQLCRDITQPVVKLELYNFNPSIFYHQAFMKVNFSVLS